MRQDYSFELLGVESGKKSERHGLLQWECKPPIIEQMPETATGACSHPVSMPSS